MFVATLDILLLLAASLLFVPSAVFFLECILSFPGGSRCRPVIGNFRPRISIVIPAHDEERAIATTVRSLQRQLMQDDRLLVVADNCSDRTAELARAAGAEVFERREPSRVGKGYALAFGIQALAKDPPDVVVFVDADCELSDSAAAMLATVAHESQRPVQAAYLMSLPEEHDQRAMVSCLAFTIKNLVRPKGLARLGMPCHLTGTGMACPWELFESVDLETDSIVEDMALGVTWALAGSPPLFCEGAQVTSALPQRDNAAKSQRTRWEHGHIETILRYVPKLMAKGARSGRIDLIALGLDLAVPPLSLLVIMILITGALGVGVGLLGGSMVPSVLAAAQLVAVAIGVVAGWWWWARKRLPFRILALVPYYLLWKIPIYTAFLSRRQRAWLRTPRDA